MRKKFLVPVGKVGSQFEVDWEALPAASQEYIIAYGLKQRLNDCHSGEKDPQLAQALVEKTLQGLLEGRVAATKSRGSAWDKHMLVEISNATNVKLQPLREKLGNSPIKLREVFNALCVKRGVNYDEVYAKWVAQQNPLGEFDLDNLLT